MPFWAAWARQALSWRRVICGSTFIDAAHTHRVRLSPSGSHSGATFTAGASSSPSCAPGRFSGAPTLSMPGRGFSPSGTSAGGVEALAADDRAATSLASTTCAPPAPWASAACSTCCDASPNAVAASSAQAGAAHASAPAAKTAAPATANRLPSQLVSPSIARPPFSKRPEGPLSSIESAPCCQV